MLCYKCQNEIPQYSLVCPRCGAEMSARSRRRSAMGFGAGVSPDGILQPMMWFTILVSFYLFFDAVSSFFTAIEYIFGPFKFFKDSLGDEIIITFSQLGAKYKIIDIIYGLLFIGFGVMAIVTRNKLAKFKKSAPLYLVIYLIVPTVISLVYSVALLIAANMFDATQLLSLVIQAAIQGAIVYANCIYFKKRKHLFKN